MGVCASRGRVLVVYVYELRFGDADVWHWLFGWPAIAHLYFGR